MVPVHMLGRSHNRRPRLRLQGFVGAIGVGIGVGRRGRYRNRLSPLRDLHPISLGMAPLQRKLTDSAAELKHIAPTQDIDELFRMEQLKRVGPDGCCGDLVMA